MQSVINGLQGESKAKVQGRLDALESSAEKMLADYSMYALDRCGLPLRAGRDWDTTDSRSPLTENREAQKAQLRLAPLHICKSHASDWSVSDIYELGMVWRVFG